MYYLYGLPRNVKLKACLSRLYFRFLWNIWNILIIYEGNIYDIWRFRCLNRRFTNFLQRKIMWWIQVKLMRTFILKKTNIKRKFLPIMKLLIAFRKKLCWWLHKNAENKNCEFLWLRNSDCLWYGSKNFNI